MTDKEQIIIDGIDVSKCRYFLKDTEGQDYNTDEFVKGCCEAKGSCIGYEFAGYGLCRGDKDCYFKQLARKTQECEELKERLERTEEDLKYQCVDCMNVKSDRYRKALEEIERELKEDIYGESQECRCDDFEECLNCVKTQILNIISKAKERENE